MKKYERGPSLFLLINDRLAEKGVNVPLETTVAIIANCDRASERRWRFFVLPSSFIDFRVGVQVCSGHRNDVRFSHYRALRKA